MSVIPDMTSLSATKYIICCSDGDGHNFPSDFCLSSKPKSFNIFKKTSHSFEKTPKELADTCTNLTDLYGISFVQKLDLCILHFFCQHLFGG